MDGEKNEWQAPPIPEKIAPAEKPEMSELATLGNVFIEPGRTFEDLRKKPRFLLGAIILAILATGFLFGLTTKIGEEGIRRSTLEQFDRNPQTANMPAEQKEGAVKMSLMVQSGVRYAMPVIIFITFLVGALIYWGAAKAFGGSGGYLHGLSLMVYASLPPAVVSSLANFLILAFKSADDIDLVASQRGLAHANLSFLVDGKAMPVVATLLSVVDVFAIWSWILTAIGLQKLNKLSAGSAWAITIIIAVIGILFRLVGAISSGNPS